MLVHALAVFTLDIEVGCRCEVVLAGSLDARDREALEVSALPDSAGEGEQSFVVILPARPDEPAGGGFAYCAFCCRRATLLPRGYLQQAFVLVSPLYAPLFRKLATLLARTYLDQGAAAFASAENELRAWPSAPTDGAVQLYLAGVTAHGSLRHSLPTALLNGALEYGEGTGLLLRCPGLLPRLWALWELLLCGRPLLVHSESAALCSEATLGLAGLLAPVGYRGLLAPYVSARSPLLPALLAAVEAGDPFAPPLLGRTRAAPRRAAAAAAPPADPPGGPNNSFICIFLFYMLRRY